MIEIDEVAGTVTQRLDGNEETFALGSRKGFEIVSKAWLRAGWDAKHLYTFTWFGRPVIQLPEDLLRVQEVIYDLKPDVVFETGFAHGGSAIFYASLMKLMGKGRMVAVDIEIRPHNRAAVEAHELYPLITMIEGDSVAPDTVAEVKKEIGDAETVLVLLDANHSRDHVRKELEAYAPLVSVGSYIVACDGIMKQVVGGRATDDDWDVNNPQTAVQEFLADHPEFELGQPDFKFDESGECSPITYFVNGWLKRVR
ncbi:MAG: CmcI family methyltransferase [Pseudomonadota bacterium]